MSCRYGDDTCCCLPSCDDLYENFCGCGVTLDVWGADECSVCAGAPHHRECPCEDCEAYWAKVAEAAA